MHPLKLTRAQVIRTAGLVLYGVSFFLTAIVDPISPALTRGHEVAFWAFLLSFSGPGICRNGFEYAALLMSGWLNPFFVFTWWTMQFKWPLAFKILRGVVLLMSPACWVVFHYRNYFPREGYFLWMIGMLLVLFSEELAGAISP